MQKICRVEGGVKGYMENPDCLIDAATRACPFCAESAPHPLRLHGWYNRRVLLPGGKEIVIPVRRLLCTRVGKTVSLLPDFCLPRRQHGPAILGRLLDGLLNRKMTLSAALDRARGASPGHSVVQGILAGFASRLDRLRAYLFNLRPRALDPPPARPGILGLVHGVFGELLVGHPSIEAAFVHHGRLFHDRQGLGLT